MIIILRSYFWRHGNRAVALEVRMEGQWNYWDPAKHDDTALAAIHRRLAYRAWRLMALLKGA